MPALVGMRTSASLSAREHLSEVMAIEYLNYHPDSSTSFLLNPPISCLDSDHPSFRHHTHSIASACLFQSLSLMICPVCQIYQDFPSSWNPRRYPRHQHRLSIVLYDPLPALKQPPRRQANPLSSRAMRLRDFEILLKWLERYDVSN